MTDTADAEVLELRRRLAEAEDTLHAIREGEVDALLVRSAGDDQVFHLGSGGETYRAFMEAMDLGAAALDEDGRLLYANAALRKLLGQRSESLAATGLVGAFDDRTALIIDALLSKASAGRQSAQITVNAGTGRRHVVLTAAPLPLGFSVGRAVTFTDITDRVDAAAAEESERIGRAIMGSATEPVIVCNAAGVVTQANPAVFGILENSPVGRVFGEAFDLSFAPGLGVMAADDFLAVALGGTPLRALEATITCGGRSKDLLVSAAPLRHVAGSIGGCIVTIIDVTDRKALEKTQALLVRELDHRMKNMLTLVASIATRTVANAAGLADFRERFGQRLAALAATQDLLAAKSWNSLLLGDLVEAELAPHVSAHDSRVLLRNLDIQIARHAAVALGLVFHELVTNAVKYGALGVPSGQVTVTATLTPAGEVELIWREQGGPPVKPPAKSGFGQTVIARGLGGSAACPTEVRFEPEGLVCRMVLARDSLA